MAESSGHSVKIIRPGYHVRPTYDLHGLRRRRKESNRGQLASELPLTAMIGLFSILVTYLLMNFSATGNPFFMAKPGLVLPRAGQANSMESAPLLTFSRGVYFLDAVAPDGTNIKIEDATPNLKEITTALHSLEAQIRTKDPTAFSGKLNLQADENTPLFYIKRAMAIGTATGWNSIAFVVTPAQ